MYIKVEPHIDGKGILNQIAKIQKMSHELHEETYKILDMIGITEVCEYEKEDSGESPKD